MNRHSQISHKIVLTGGGSGGHITPILSVAQEIKMQEPNSRLVYIGQKGDSLASNILDTKLIDEFYYIRAGKWRRYHGESFWQHLGDYKTVFLNIRDIFNFLIGTVQAWMLLKRLRPDVIFVKGGFVGLPVGISAKLRGISFITHDSDAIPGLTNKIIGRWAKYNAVGMPAQLYAYPKSKIIYTGVPVKNNFNFVSKVEKDNYRHQLKLNLDSEVIFVVGGGLGAKNLNEVILHIAPRLMADRPNLNILHITGMANYEAVLTAYKGKLSKEQLSNVRVVDFTNELNVYSAAADLVIMRAGATNLAEMAIQAKACILVPNPKLTGGHQLKNVEFWASANAVKVYDESQPADKLQTTIVKLLDNDKMRSKLERSITKFAMPSSSKSIAELLIKTS